MGQFTKLYEAGKRGWKDYGHRKEIKIKGVDILYALSEKTTFSGDAQKRFTLIEEYKISKMAQECASRAFPKEENPLTAKQIKAETQKAWLHEHEDWETSDVGATQNPQHRRRRERQ